MVVARKQTLFLPLEFAKVSLISIHKVGLSALEKFKVPVGFLLSGAL